MVKPFPCPRCGDRDTVVIFDELDWFAFCLECRFEGPRRSTPEQATADWNVQALAEPTKDAIPE